MAELAKILESINELPTLPDIVAKLTRLVTDPRTSADDINDALSQDPGLTAKILKLVNSSFYGFSRRISTITNAVVILGFNQVRNLALSAFTIDSFSAADGNANFDMKAFWRHSIGVAFLAARIAKRLSAKFTEDAFICGLLHDLGKSLLALKAPDGLNLVVDAVRRENILFYAAEKMTLGFDHTELGAAITERWNFPKTIVDVIRWHHDPLRAPEPAVPLSCAVNFADIAARSMLMGSGGDDRIPALAEGVWERLALDWLLVEKIMRTSAGEYRESGLFFGLR